MTRSIHIPVLAGAAVIPLTALTFVAGTHVANAGTTRPTIASERPVNASGQGLTAFGAGWFVVSPAGNEIK